MLTPRPHDLLWLNDSHALEAVGEAWVAGFWHPALPVVVRRDSGNDERIPVGIRGMRRDQRAAGWTQMANVKRCVSPEALAGRELLLSSPFVSQPPIQAALQLASRQWPWRWGVTGSAGYALATEIPVLHATSDLDLLIRCPEALSRERFSEWQNFISQLPCRADTQIETPHGAFALLEWLRAGRVLLKTSTGPRLVRNPWLPEEDA